MLTAKYSAGNARDIDYEHTNAYTQFRNEELGISFFYPIEWGVLEVELHTSCMDDEPGVQSWQRFSAIPVSLGVRSKKCLSERGYRYAENPALFENVPPDTTIQSEDGITVDIWYSFLGGMGAPGPAVMILRAHTPYKGAEHIFFVSADIVDAMDPHDVADFIGIAHTLQRF